MEAHSYSYVWGFNGFSQISQVISCHTEESGATENTSSAEEDVCFSYPRILKIIKTLKGFISSWERLVLIGEDNQIFISGYNCGKCAVQLQSQKQSDDQSEVQSVPPSWRQSGVKECVMLGNDVLFGRHDAAWSFLKAGEVTLHTLHTRPDFVAKFSCATNKEMILVDDSGDLHRGYVDQSGPQFYMTVSRIVTETKIMTVACGLEHVILLSDTGAIFSYGCGSRGQLGHGILSVDEQKSVRVIEALEGIPVSSVSAGGWHSTAVTVSGDLYVWGWNESGQLGIPNSDDAVDPLLSSKSTHSLEKLKHYSSHSGLKSDDLTWRHTCSHTLGNCGCTCHSKSESSNVKEKEKQDNNDTCLCHFSSYAPGNQNDKNNSENTVDDNCESCLCEKRQWSQSDIPIVLAQDTEPVQVLTEPYPIDIPDTMVICKVACGTRHTAVLLDSGVLLTTGWNGYGQLGHGDTDSRMAFNTVMFFVDRNLKVKDVVCSAWHTAATVKEIS